MDLGFGADDYVSKPFSMIELTARVQASIRRATEYALADRDAPASPAISDQVQDVIGGAPTLADLLTYAARMIIHSLMIALASLIPLFTFGLWKRLVIPTVICAIVLMQLPTILSMLRITINTDLLYSILSILGVASVVLSVKLVNKAGDL